MGQYQPDHQVRGSTEYADLARRAHASEVAAVEEEARAAGLWRLDRTTLSLAD